MNLSLRRSYVAFTVVPLVFFLAVAVARPPAFDLLANFVFDSYQRLQPRIWRADAPVRIIDIDDESLARIGQWPWPRSVLAEIVNRAADQGAATLAFDVLFSEADRLSPDQIARSISAAPQRAAVERALAGTIGNDALLASAMTRLPVVLGTILTHGDAVRAPVTAKAGFVHAGDDPLKWIVHYPNATAPLPILVEAAAGVGAMNWLPGRDQIIREVPLLLRQGDVLTPSLAAEALRTAQGASTILVRSSNASGQTALGRSTGINALKIGEFEIFSGAHGERRIHFSHTEPRRFIPAWKFLAGQIDVNEIKGRILLVGTSAAGLLDQRATPLDRTVAGVEVHAQMIEHVVAGGHLARPDWAPGLEMLAALALSLGVSGLAYFASPIIGAAVGFVTVASMLAFGWFAFSGAGLLVDPLFPSITAGLTYLSGLVELFRHERRQKALVKEAFGRFVSPAVVERLSASRSRLVLGGESRDLTLLFCDLRDFTSLSEGLTAEQLTTFMNDYLTPMTDVILEHDGTIDKYMGDAVMAFWNAPLDDPNHARSACLAALAMRTALEEFNAYRKDIDVALGRRELVARFGIGVNTGLCSVGNLGSVRRFDYSAIGDPVNVASRLEGLTKFYGVDVLATHETHIAAGDLAWLEVDEVRVKGRATPTTIYLLVGGAEEATSTDFAALSLRHGTMLAAYRARQFDDAISQAQALADTRPQLRRFYERYTELCFEAAAEPAHSWSPIRNMTEK
jgi:adenylate cyclase